jgi:hypothetical protein
MIDGYIDATPGGVFQAAGAAITSVLVQVHEAVEPVHAFDVPVATHVPCARAAAGSKRATAARAKRLNRTRANPDSFAD